MQSFINGTVPLRILYLEDSPDDVDLVQKVIENAGFNMIFEDVAKEADFVLAIQEKTYDLILADYNLPGFFAPAAMAHAKMICPETPFICVSGRIDDDIAVELLKNGAADYVSKVRIKRLPVVMERALKDAELKKERKYAAEIIRISEARLSEAQSIARLGSWEWNLLTNEIAWSKELCRLFGFAPETIDQGIDSLRTAINSRIHPDDLENYKKAVSLCLDQREPYSVDYRIRLSDGLERNINAQGNLIFDSAGTPVKMVGTAMDITERMQVEDALRKSEEKYRLLADHMSDIVFLMDLNFRVTYQSPSSEKLRGFTSQEIRDLPMEKNLAPESLNRAMELFYREIPRIEAEPDYNPVTLMDLEYYRKNGTTFWLENKFSIIRNGNGKPVSILGEGRDISDRKRAEAEIALKNEQLVFANAEKDKFFSILAHDLRSPFNAFLGFTQMLDEELDSFTLKEIQQIAASMRNSASNLFKLLENLLEWSRIRRGLSPYNPEMILLAPAVAECIKPIVDSAVKKGIAMNSEISEDLEVFADKYMLTSVIRNLASNAVKFTNSGGYIMISANVTTGMMAEIYIRDSGIGMNQDMLSNLFRLDVQTNRKGTEGESSSGLGLIICKEFIEKQGGKLWCESEEGNGSQFFFTLPATKSE